jgi:hypothetical protein
MAAGAQDQPVPFDMSGERGPVETAPGTAEGTPSGGKTVVQPEKKAAAPEVGIRRYIIPAESLLLEGEAAGGSYPVFLTPQQAASATSLTLGYSNAVVVAPESSRLTVIVNDLTVKDLPIQSPEGTKDIRLELPKGLLRPGLNRVTFNAIHRHRTDCTIRSTYDLWTSLDPARTYIEVPRDTSTRLQTTDDISAVGLGPSGQTKFVMVVPEMGQPAATNALMRLSQGLALMAKMPNQTFDVVEAMPSAAGAGELTVLLGTAGDLAGVLPNLPAAARSSAVATFVDTPAGDRKVFVVSGPDWPTIEGAVEGMIAPIDRPIGVSRDALSVRQRNATEMPLLAGETSLTLSSLGVRTGEFTGRRFRAGFDVGVPSDFYADAYGEARILLDAAYSSQVQPGSHIDVYVNGNIASTVPITSRTGGIFRHLPIRVTMRHFRPGPNRIDIEAVLLTEADKVCAPGASASAEPRFALFDSTEFRMPRFARIAQLPNLAALAGTGFPYSRQADPIALYLDRLDGDTLSTSATFLGKMAVASGRALPVRPESSALAIGERNAILVGTLSQLPPLVLGQTHIDGESASSWGGPPETGARGAATRDSFNEWQTRVSGGSWRGQMAALETWLQETFDISLSSLRLLPGEEPMVTPDDSARFLIAQGDSPDRSAAWTVLSAPDGASLRAGMSAVAQEVRWQQLQGYVSLESKDADSLDTRPVSRTRFFATQPWTFSNARLIAANWLSSNILAYAAVFCALAILLGIATSGLLRRFGREV